MARRNIKIELRLNEQEMERLRRDVARSGWSREKYLRALIEHSSIREMPSMDLISVLRNLQQINYEALKGVIENHEKEALKHDAIH